MRREPLSASRSRILALGILAILLGVAWLGVAKPLLATGSRQRTEIGSAERALTELRRVAAERPALEQAREVLRKADAAQHLTQPAESDGVAAATLQRVVKTAVDGSGGTLQSTQVKPTRTDGAFRRIGLRVQMLGTVEALRGTLVALEAAQPLVFGEALDLRPRQTMRSTGKDAVEDRVLEIRFDVYSLARPLT